MLCRRRPDPFGCRRGSGDRKRFAPRAVSIRADLDSPFDACVDSARCSAPKEQVVRITQVFRSIPAQIAKENKKFVFGMLKKGARAKDFELAIQWLMDAGLVHKVCQVSKPEAPLTFYEESDAFKLFLLDCGLLGAMNMTDATEAMLTDNIFEEYNGALTEQLVLWLRNTTQCNEYGQNSVVETKHNPRGLNYA